MEIKKERYDQLIKFLLLCENSFFATKKLKKMAHDLLVLLSHDYFIDMVQNHNRNLSQAQRDILNHLISGKSITPIEAYELYGCLRLSSVIHRLRKKHTIYTEMIELKKGVRIAKYYMK